jgi:hypothetical protein
LSSLIPRTLYFYLAPAVFLIAWNGSSHKQHSLVPKEEFSTL